MIKRKPEPAKARTPRREPNAQERAAIKKAKAYCRSRTQPIAYDVKKIEGGNITIQPPHNDLGAFEVLQRATFGTVSPEFANRTAGEVGNIMRSAGKPMPEPDQLNAGIAAVAGIEPQNETEAMLAVQMVGTHSVAMEMLSKAKHATNTDQLERFGTLATKLLRTYTTQIEALAKIRRGGSQRSQLSMSMSTLAAKPSSGTSPGDREGAVSKMEANPMHPPSLDRQPSPFRLIPRCCAQTRAGTPCMSPAVKGKKRCRMHGGAKGIGAPKGERNGSYRTGMFTAEMVELRREVNRMVRISNAAIRAGLG